MSESTDPQNPEEPPRTNQPPPPTLTGKPLVEERTFTPYPWLDYSLGFLTTVIGCAILLIGAVLPLGLYFVTRKTYPVYARGTLHGFIGVGLLIGGALAICVTLIFNN